MKYLILAAVFLLALYVFIRIDRRNRGKSQWEDTKALLVWIPFAGFVVGGVICVALGIKPESFITFIVAMASQLAFAFILWLLLGVFIAI